MDVKLMMMMMIYIYIYIYITYAYITYASLGDIKERHPAIKSKLL